jgi:hypothetical protein
VAQAILNNVIFLKGVPTVLRSDSVPEPVAGMVRDINKHLGICQVQTGGYNPRGNAIYERANQTIGAMLRRSPLQKFQKLPSSHGICHELHALRRPKLHPFRSRARVACPNHRASTSRLRLGSISCWGQRRHVRPGHIKKVRRQHPQRHHGISHANVVGRTTRKRIPAQAH